ncbi:ANTAR domain-containing protein [Micromonospora sp. BL4]|uniref:GAF and ANTAR domain-containing protein n=1 Tax=Micromonospora sp. BL4 TaxID=2478710 RepID=UPI000EF6055F|nr:GAF and ANTAR domain-containing protein [Micromonospora sp. BL4]RLP93553.1 ANTAR domain-containing protein [Micromonospora sp. BL4]
MPQTPLDLTQALIELGTIRYGEASLNAVLVRITEIAKQTVPGSEDVSVTLIQGSRSYTAAYTGDLALRLDELQYEQGRGPCLDAASSGTVIMVEDMATERRWPTWAASARATGAASSLSVALPIQEAVVGALNIYGRAPRAFTEVVQLAQTFAGHAAVAVANAQRYDSAAALAEQMRNAMRSRAVIEQAKGIIMERRRCSADEAFAVLAKISQDSNQKLRDVAETLVEQATHRRRS